MRNCNDQICSLLAELCCVCVSHIDCVLPYNPFTCGLVYKIKKTDIQTDETNFDLADAGVVSNTKFAGCGTVLGAAFGGGVRIYPGIGEGWTSGELPVFDGCSFQRGVMVEIDSSIAQKLSLPSPHRVAVARFVGNAPDVSCWRVSRSWGRSDVRGKFSIEDDTVYMTVDYSGLKLIVR